MFDISFSELLLVAIIATGLFGPKEVIALVKNVTYYWHQIKNWYTNYLNYLHRELSVQAQVKGNVMRYITDQDGILQEVYDINATRPNIISKPKEGEPGEQ